MRQAVQSRSRGWLASFVALFLLSLAGKAAPPPHQAGGSPKALEPVDVGMVALVAVPERYDGKFVRTHGFLSIEFEGDALYLHEEDYRHGLTKNSLALRLSKSQRQQFKSLSLKYVVIEGTVDARGLEQTDKWSGALGKITRLEIWPMVR